MMFCRNNGMKCTSVYRTGRLSSWNLEPQTSDEVDSNATDKSLSVVQTQIDLAGFGSDATNNSEQLILINLRDRCILLFGSVSIRCISEGSRTV